MLAHNSAAFGPSHDTLPVCLRNENPNRLVSLWDMLPFFAYDFCRASGIIGQLYSQIRSGVAPTSDSWGAVAGEMGMLERTCEPLGLVNTLAQIKRIKPILTKGSQSVNFMDFARDIIEVQTRLIDELQSRALFCLRLETTHYFKEPRAGWEEVIKTFPDTTSDIEEARMCFALDRYAACVFHCVQIIETGLIALGSFVKVNDPKSGWTAVTGKLATLVTKTKYPDLDPLYQKHFAFLEQMHGTVGALNTAWRNKISHAQGRLIVMTADFSPHVAEEILVASRGFMRRLATDLP